MGKASKRRRREPETVLEYFFEDGDPSKPRTELVRRDELWAALDWYDRRVRGPRAWLHRLWRSIRRLPRWEPMAWIRLEQEKRRRGS